jgi:hypothetical protein
MTSALAADTTKMAERPEYRWFVLLGGPSDKPVWTVSRWHPPQDYPLYVDQIGAFALLMESALGVRSIIVSTSIADVSPRPPSDATRLNDANLVEPSKLSTEELSSTLLRSVRSLASVSDDLILELQTPLYAMFSDAYLSRYTDQPPIVAMSRRPQDSKLRLCQLTRQLAGIAELRETRGEGTNKNSVVALTVASDVAAIETAWRDSILKPYGLTPQRLHVWESLSTIEVVFTNDVPFASWAGSIAGMKLGSFIRIKVRRDQP